MKQHNQGIWLQANFPNKKSLFFEPDNSCTSCASDTCHNCIDSCIISNYYITFLATHFCMLVYRTYSYNRFYMTSPPWIFRGGRWHSASYSEWLSNFRFSRAASLMSDLFVYYKKIKFYWFVKSADADAVEFSADADELKILLRKSLAIAKT